jgi:hypothetical protein
MVSFAIFVDIPYHAITISGPYYDGMTTKDFPLMMSRYSKGLLRHSESSANSATFGLSCQDVFWTMSAVT